MGETQTQPLGEVFIENSVLKDQSEVYEESPGVWTWDEVRCIGDTCKAITRCHVDAGRLTESSHA